MSYWRWTCRSLCWWTCRMDIEREMRKLEAAANEAVTGETDKLLGQFVRVRRRQLHLTQDLQPRGGPSAATVRAIEAGNPPDMQRGTKRGLEGALEWPEGSIDFLRSPADSTVSHEAKQRRYKALLEPPENARKDASATTEQDIVATFPPGTFDGMSQVDIDEAISFGRSMTMTRAREIRQGRQS